MVVGLLEVKKEEALIRCFSLDLLKACSLQSVLLLPSRRSRGRLQSYPIWSLFLRIGLMEDENVLKGRTLKEL